MTDALFEKDGPHFVPTGFARGPWSPLALHGGPPAALLARSAERCEGGEGMLVARITVELLRPVPVEPLTVEHALLRPGRKVQLVAVSLRAGEVEVARATALRIRTIDLPVPAGSPADAPPPGPEAGRHIASPGAFRDDAVAFHSHGVEHRFVAGGFDRPGPATDWIRLRVPLVAGEVTSPLAGAVAVADFGNGVSWVVSPQEGWQFINPDLTVALHRLPAGEWVCLQAVTIAESTGVGQAESLLWDERGRIGRAVQTLLIDRPR